ncbi:MAG: hypothetical protein R6W77_02655 [Trueperaceae bacterium]
MPSPVFQDDLFSPARWIERTVQGVTVRVRLEPLGGGRVRLVRYERKRPGERAFTRRADEEGRVVALRAVAPETDYEELFGATR